MKIIRKISKLYICCILIFSGISIIVSCDDELNLYPEDYFSTENFWTTSDQFEKSIIAIANQFRGFSSQILFEAGELRAGTLELSTIDGSGTTNSNFIQNIYTESFYQFSNFGGYYGFIGNLNWLIYNCNNTTVELSDDLKNGLLGIAYGWRAYAYFQMYRMYGGVCLRLTPDVFLGEYNPEKLYMARSTAEETLSQIKNDIQMSLDYFSKSDYTYDSSAPDYYWSKACTEMLAGEVYLWSGKVSTDDHEAQPSDVSTAATYFNNVINNYGYSLEQNYSEIWTTKHNKESIFSFNYSNESDKVFYSSYNVSFLWARVTGTSYNNYWSTHDEDGWGHVKGVANRFGRWHDPQTGEDKDMDLWALSNFGPMRYTYKNALYYQFDEEDSRIDQFYPQWRINEDENELTYIADFDPHKHKLAGTFVCKFRPKIISSSPYYQFIVDVPIYRLALAYLYAAECANYEGNNELVEHYINAVRERAYGDNWNEKFSYEAGSFLENEIAILHEKDKEFFQEGQRWWDLRRLTSVKGGTQQDHLVFQQQGCVGYGLKGNDWMVDINGDPIETDVPVLSDNQDEHLLLWPIDETLMNSDPEIEQNPGY